MYKTILRGSKISNDLNVVPHNASGGSLKGKTTVVPSFRFNKADDEIVEVTPSSSFDESSEKDDDDDSLIAKYTEDGIDLARAEQIDNFVVSLEDAADYNSQIYLQKDYLSYGSPRTGI